MRQHKDTASIRRGSKARRGSSAFYSEVGSRAQSRHRHSASVEAGSKASDAFSYKLRINTEQLASLLRFVNLSVNTTQISSSLDIDIVRVGNHSEAVCEVSGVWLGLVQRVVKLEALHHGRHEDEEGVRGEAHPHADPPMPPCPRPKETKRLCLTDR